MIHPGASPGFHLLLKVKAGAWICEDGGGVISEDDAGGGEQKWLFLSNVAAIGRASGDAVKRDLRGGVLGTAVSEISAGGASGPGAECSVCCDMNNAVWVAVNCSPAS